MTTKTKRKTRGAGKRRSQSRTELQTLWLAQEIYARSIAKHDHTDGAGISEEFMVYVASKSIRAAEIFFPEFESSRGRRARLASRSKRKP